MNNDGSHSIVYGGDYQEKIKMIVDTCVFCVNFKVRVLIKWFIL